MRPERFSLSTPQLLNPPGSVRRFRHLKPPHHNVALLTALLSLLTALLSLLTAPLLLANGRFPAANQLVVDPGQESRIILRTTYGILLTEDGGDAWDWVCEESVGYTGEVDPAIAVTASGALAAAFYGGVSISRDSGCLWTLAGDGLQGANVVDISVDPSDRTRLVALSTTALGAGTYDSAVWSSADDGTTWSLYGPPLPSNLIPLTLDVSPADPWVIYVSGQVSGGYGEGALLRFDPLSEHWSQASVPYSDTAHAPYIGAVAPAPEDRVYVRLSGSPGRLLMTDDAGTEWSDLFLGGGSLKGFAQSPDGSILVVGGDADGIWRGSPDTLEFEAVSPVRPQCLTWTEEGVYACALEYNDGFTVGVSTDGGATFDPIYLLSCVRGPVACTTDPPQDNGCDSTWTATADLIDQDTCYPPVENSPDQDASPDPTSDSGKDEEAGGCTCVSGRLKDGRTQASDTREGGSLPFGPVIPALVLCGAIRWLRRRPGGSCAPKRTPGVGSLPAKGTSNG